MAETRPVRKAGGEAAVTLKVTLQGSKPPIWRRLVMPAGASLGRLHSAIQAAMGWRDSHLHAFDAGGRTYSASGMADGGADESRVTLGALARAGHKRFTYTYDFGDSWEHLIVIEKLGVAGDGLETPACIAGKRACPPEDCGGVWGYYELLDALADPDHPDREDRLEWLGEDFDPEAFDLAHADKAVKARAR
jgi:hypothetical protein